jgi:hypothetical protein
MNEDILQRTETEALENARKMTSTTAILTKEDAMVERKDSSSRH